MFKKTKINKTLFLKQKVKKYSTRNAGIVAIESHIPNFYVDQTDLEQYDGVTSGKYVKGLEQTKMGFINNREDIISMSLTSLGKLIKNYNLDFKDIGKKKKKNFFFFFPPFFFTFSLKK